MILSWNWLKDYVAVNVPVAEFERRLMMAGLNHESTTPVGDDLAIDLEVTSNRPDCLGHLGIARETAVLFGLELQVPKADPVEASARVADLTRVQIDCPDLCYQYTARVIRNVKIGPSPAWLVRRLATLGLPAINNVVDITNYVLMECGQPLHAFDLAKLRGREIIVREAHPSEALEAIDHRTYELGSGICVIADKERAVAVGGVMGGADTEVTTATKELLIESAEFDSLAIRNAARRLNLHSDSSYRFERGIDPGGVDWASRRCCELVLDLAGGELAAGVYRAGRPLEQRQPIKLRLGQLKRVLGIEIDPARVREILTALGNEQRSADDQQVEVVPPSWRADLSREIDLVEEVARVHGYEAIPEDVSVPMAPSARSNEDRVLSKVRHVLTAVGFDEALTISIVDEDWSQAFSPWTSAPPLMCRTPILRRADRLRRSLLPSLLGARRTNETLANSTIELFEIARVYLLRGKELPFEDLMLGLTSGGDFWLVKGVIERLVAAINPSLQLAVVDLPVSGELLDPQVGCQFRLQDEVLGYLGQVSAAGLKRFELRGETTVAELRLAPLVQQANLVPRYLKQPEHPAVTRDLNLEVDETVRWAELANVVRQHGGPCLERVDYQDTYRDPARMEPGKKRLLLTITLRDPNTTLTSQQADAIRDEIVAACTSRFGAVLR